MPARLLRSPEGLVGAALLLLILLAALLAPVLFPGDRRSLALYNAGSSTELRHVRVFSHRRGRLAVHSLDPAAAIAN